MRKDGTTEFMGRFRDGEKWEGKGEFGSDPVYFGWVKAGRYDGKGTLTYQNGKKYVGRFNKENEYHGNGTLYQANGEIYIGEFNRGKFHGEGLQTWTSGLFKKYMGHYTHGKFNGKGTLTFAAGYS